MRWTAKKSVRFWVFLRLIYGCSYTEHVCNCGNVWKLTGLRKTMNKIIDKFVALSPFVSCQVATRLISESMERKLSHKERIDLWIHLRLCEFCVRFLRQVHGLSKIARSYKLQDM